MRESDSRASGGPGGAEGPLRDLRVVEWGEHVSAPYAARLLAELGADVVKVEEAGGDVARRNGPFPGGRPDPERSGLFHVLNYEKRGVAVDLDRPRDVEALRALAAGADVFLTNVPLERRRRHGLDGPSLLALNPALVAVSVTPFGDSGPYRAAPGCSLTSSALGGASWVIGLPDRPPLALPFDLADYEGGAQAAGAALAAVVAGARGRAGQMVDVAVAEVIAGFVATNASFYVGFGLPWHRAGPRASGAGGSYPYGILPCRDGHVAIIGRSQADWENIRAALGSPAWAAEPEFDDAKRIARERPERADELLAPLLAAHTRAELVELATEHRFALAPVRTIAEVLDEPQFRARHVFADGIELDGRPLTPPTSPLFALRAPGARTVRPAPRLGEHNDELLASAARAPAARVSPSPVVGAGSAGALAGIRVIDMTWVWSGPMVGAMLADLGAEVIKVEHRGRLDNARLRGTPLRDGVPVEGPPEETSPYFHQNNRGKLSVTLDMKHPDGARLLRGLIDRSDVLLDNFTVGVLERAGLGYDTLAQTNPGLVMLSMTAAGATGPLRGMRGYAPIMTALSGVESLVGYHGEPPLGMVTCALGDPNAGSHAAAAVLAALAGRERSGRGTRIDFSQTEAMVAVVAEAVAHLQLTGRDPGERRLTHPLACPHGNYPCAGEDRWIAIAVCTDGQWQRLVELLGGELADARFADAAGRQRHRAAVDAAVAARTAARERDELAAALRAAEVPAAPVLALGELRSDAHLVERGLYEEVEHPIAGAGTLVTSPWRMSATPTRIAGPAPLVGQHTRDVLRDVLGLGDEEIDRHEQSGAAR